MEDVSPNRVNRKSRVQKTGCAAQPGGEGNPGRQRGGCRRQLCNRHRGHCTTNGSTKTKPKAKKEAKPWPPGNGGRQVQAHCIILRSSLASHIGMEPQRPTVVTNSVAHPWATFPPPVSLPTPVPGDHLLEETTCMQTWVSGSDFWVKSRLSYQLRKGRQELHK